MKKAIKPDFSGIYEKLNNDERINLVISAAQRGDREQVKELCRLFRAEEDPETFSSFDNVIRNAKTQELKLISALFDESFLAAFLQAERRVNGESVELITHEEAKTLLEIKENIGFRLRNIGCNVEKYS